jgi:inhibitor of cysteine peptidase
MFFLYNKGAINRFKEVKTMIGFKTKKTKGAGFVCFSLFVLILLFGSRIMAVEEDQKKMFVMSDGDESHITVKAPGEFSIKIKSNPTTGYSWWQHSPGEKEESPIKFKEKKVEEPGDRPEQERKLGAPTYEIFTFEALEPGEVMLELHYRRPWEKDVPPIKKHKIHVTVE